MHFHLLINYVAHFIFPLREHQAVIPGGSSVPVLDENDCQEVMMDFDDLKVSQYIFITTSKQG